MWFYAKCRLNESPGSLLWTLLAWRHFNGRVLFRFLSPDLQGVRQLSPTKMMGKSVVKFGCPWSSSVSSLGHQSITWAASSRFSSSIEYTFSINTDKWMQQSSGYFNYALGINTDNCSATFASYDHLSPLPSVVHWELIALIVNNIINLLHSFLPLKSSGNLRSGGTTGGR